MRVHSLLCILGTVVYASALAGGLKQGRITSIQVTASIPDKALIAVSGSNPYLREPSCSQDPTTQFDYILDISTSTGKAIYAMAHAAQASGAQVTLEGFGTCNLRAGYEDLNYIHIDTP